LRTSTTIRGFLILALLVMAPGVGWAQNQILQTAGVDDAEVAADYYNTIDPGHQRMTQADWEEVNGFNSAVNTVVDVRGYYNAGDLNFWRSIQMVRDKRPGYRRNIAFTTVNYLTEADSLSGDNPASIVNMEYSRGPEGDRLVKFYIYDEVTGERKLSTNFSPFDSRSQELFVPAACYSCHGGDDDDSSPVGPDGYNEGSGETNAGFMAFDVSTMEFDVTTLASLEAGIRKLNKAVLRTDPSKATRKLIKGLYGGKRLPNATQDLDYIPASWDDDGDNEYLYREVIVPTCRICHTNSDTKLLRLSWWEANPKKIREAVFHELLMPNSIPNFDRFWDSSSTPRQYEVLFDALDRFENP